MFHPLIRLLASKPQLVAHHLGGYVELASAEAQQAVSALQARLLWMAGAVAGAVAGVLLAGVAALLAAALPLAGMPAPWLLLLVPLAAWLAGAACWLQASRLPLAGSLQNLRAQLAADAALLAELEMP